MTLLARRLAPALTAAIAICLMGGVAEAQRSAKSVLNPPGLPDTTQYGYSQAATTAPGAQVLYVAGQVGWVAGAANDFASQVDRAFANLQAVLAAGGSRVEDVVKITLLIKDHDPEKLAYLVTKRRAVFGTSPPASTLIPVTALYAEDVSFEIDAVAVVAARFLP